MNNMFLIMYYAKTSINGVRLFVTLWTVTYPPAFLIHGILQARILEWVDIPSLGDLPDRGIEATFLMSPALAGGNFTTSSTW